MPPGNVSTSDDGVPLHVRWMVLRDLPQVMQIEGQVGKTLNEHNIDGLRSWSKEQYKAMFRQHGVMGRVLATRFGQEIVAAMVYQLTYRKVLRHRIIVPLHARRRGHGSRLLRPLDRHISKATWESRPRNLMECHVHERMVGCQLFLRANGWVADDLSEGEAARINGEAKAKRIEVPRVDGLLLDIGEDDKPWYQFDRLNAYLEKSCDPEWTEAVVGEMDEIFRRWRWRERADAMEGISALTCTGLVLSTWVQTLWRWRPQVAIIGSSKTGKTMLCEMLGGSDSGGQGLFGGLSMLSSQSSEAGTSYVITRKNRG